MPRKRKQSTTYTDILAMAEAYGVASNPLFRAAASQYDLQQAVIQRMRESLDDDEVIVTKEYVKGRENACANPIIRELPKNCDSANRTLAAMINVITSLGHEPNPSDNKTLLGSLMENE